MEGRNIKFNDDIPSTDSKTSDPTDYRSSESSEVKSSFGSSEACSLSVNKNLTRRSRGKRASKSARNKKRFENTGEPSNVFSQFGPTDHNFNNDECFVKFNGKFQAKTIKNIADDYDRIKATIITKPKNINCIQFGMFEIDTWYYSPYPYEYGDDQERLFICEFCLKYMKLEKSYTYHLGACPCRGPPGKEVYRKDGFTIHEVDAVLNRLYCQNLCLLSKLFINHKTVFYDVDKFLFYVLCEEIDSKAHIRGHFSKEKGSPNGQNLNYLLTIPPFQGLGYGKMLIGFSYELSKLEGVPGSPARPLSELGIISYESYWSWVILNLLRNSRGTISITSMSRNTGFTETDIIRTLKSLKLLKNWTSPDTIRITPDLIKAQVVSGIYKKPQFLIDPQTIKWTPSWLPRKTPLEHSESSSDLSSSEISSLSSLSLPSQHGSSSRHSP